MWITSAKKNRNQSTPVRLSKTLMQASPAGGGQAESSERTCVAKFVRESEVAQEWDNS